MSEKIIRGVGCPACGGSLDIEEGQIILTCKFCGAGLMVKGDRGVQRFYVPVTKTREEILAAVKKWFNKFDKAPDLKAEAKFCETFLVYVPFWRVNATVIGWVLGEEKKGSGKDAKWVAVERRVNQKYEFTCPACDIGEFGVKWVDLQGDEVRPFDLEEVQQQGMTFGVMTTPTDVLKTCDEKFLEWGKKSARVDRISFSRLHAVHERYCVVFYPLWIVRYEYKNRIYQVTADAEGGQLLYGRAPGNNLYRVACLLGSITTGDFVLTSSLRSSLMTSEDNPIIPIIIGCIILMFFGWRKFRYGGEVKIEQKDKLGTKSVANLLPDFLSKKPELASILKKI